MKISVALCTYNGAQFIQEQLDSLLAQKRRPDEIVVCDDGSTDQTLQILKQFQSVAPVRVEIHSNSGKLGPAKNFEKAITLCQGDLIALCDQDDVWLPEKLALAERHFLEFPDDEVIFSNGHVVKADLSPFGYTLWEQVGFTLSERRKTQRKRGLEVLLRHVAATGATMVIKTSIRDRALPIPDGWMHDAWIAIIAAVSGTLNVIPTPLFLYRQHAVNAIGALRRSLLQRIEETFHISSGDYYALEIGRYKNLRERVLMGTIKEADLALINGKLRHLEFRSTLPESRSLRVMPIMGELLRSGYSRYSTSWQVAVKDFLLSKRKP